MTRRGNGEGSVYRRKDGYWVATAHDAAGKRREFYGRTRGAAMRKRKEAADRLAMAAPITDSRSKLSTVYRHWLTVTLPSSGLNVSTQALYASLLRTHIMPALGDQPIATIRPSAVQAVLAGLSLAPSSKRSTYAALRKLFDAAVTDGLVVDNPVAKVRRPTVPHLEAPALEVDELLRLLAAAKGTRLECLWTLLAGTGMRRGEALGLRWSDIDSDVLRIRRTLRRVPGIGLVESPPKTGSGRRTIDLSPELVVALDAHRARQNVERLAAGTAWSDEDWVFGTEIGTALDPRGVNRSFAEIRKAGVTATPHTLRHTAATSLLGAGHPLVVVAELLGHSSPTITLEVYGHALPTARKAASADLGRLLGG